MRLLRLVVGVVLVSAVAADGSAQTRPDFSGTWKFDQVKSVQPGPDGKVVLAAMLGDEFTARQEAESLNLTISSGPLRVGAVYKLDGSESRNMSPGGPGQPDVVVISRASWDGNKLVITSTSTSTVQGRPVAIVTRRVVWLDPDGNLILDRTGTPASEITPTRSVYTKVVK